MYRNNQQPHHRSGAVPNPVWVGSKWLLVFPSYPEQSWFFQNDRRKAARSFFEIGGLSFLLSCLSLARLLILLLLLMSGNVHLNPCSVFPCSVCAENVTTRGSLVQCCTCFKWIHWKCSQLSFSRFRALGSSYSWSCPPFCVSASSGDPTLTSTVTSSLDSASLYTSAAQSGPSAPPSAIAAHRSILAFKPVILLPLHPYHSLMLLDVSLHRLLYLLLLDSFRVLQ